MTLHKHNSSQKGIALIIVMLIVVVFGILAGGLAYSMKVETKLARNSSWDTELEWLGRSGIEYAKFLLTPCGGPAQPYDALNQKWAGGTGETNTCSEGMSLTDMRLGHGKFSVKIKDCDSKFNINLAVLTPEIVNQACILMGVDAAEAPQVVNAIVDWVDRDNAPRMGSSDTESDYYLTLQPPYRAKNGPIDDLTEMMMIRGITPGMFYGSGGGAAMISRGIPVSNRFNRRSGEEPVYPLGFADLFTTISGRFINVNTASAEVLQLIPDVDGVLANAVIETRNGPDRAQGNEDDMPFRSIGEIRSVPGMTAEVAALFGKYFSTRSSTFEVEVETEIDAVKRTYYAILRRTGNANQIVTLFMYWR